MRTYTLWGFPVVQWYKGKRHGDFLLYRLVTYGNSLLYVRCDKGISCFVPTDAYLMIHNRDFLSCDSWHVHEADVTSEAWLLADWEQNRKRWTTCGEQKMLPVSIRRSLPQMKNISISFVSVQREIQFTGRKIGIHSRTSRGVFFWGNRWITANGNQSLSVPDDSNVPPSERHNLHGACVAEGDWIFPHLRRSHAEDLAVSKNNASLGNVAYVNSTFNATRKIRGAMFAQQTADTPPAKFTEFARSTRVRKITRLYVLIPLPDP